MEECRLMWMSGELVHRSQPNSVVGLSTDFFVLRVTLQAGGKRPRTLSSSESHSHGKPVCFLQSTVIRPAVIKTDVVVVALILQSCAQREPDF